MVEFDPLALDVLNELNERYDDQQIEAYATWEHEELAQVRIRVLRGHLDGVKSCQLCAGDSRLLSASSDRTVFMWDVKTGQVLKKYTNRHSLPITAAKANSDVSQQLCVSELGQNNLSLGYRNIQRAVPPLFDDMTSMYDYARMSAIVASTIHLNVFRLSSSDPDCSLMARTLTLRWSGTHGGIVMNCDFSHNGRLVVSASDVDNSIRVWDSHNGCLVQELRDLHSSTVTSCYFNLSDDRLFTTSMDYSCRVWDLKTCTNTITLSGHTNVVSDSSCTADEHKLATVSWDKSIKVWDISTGEYRLRGCDSIEKSHVGNVSSCDFSKDGSLLVTGGYDQQVILWDIDNMIQKLKLQGHSAWVEDVSFSEDQKWIVSCSKDKTIRMWNVENADNIPMVIENKKTARMKLFNCTQCGKPFSVTQMADETKLCVFCRRN